MGPNRGTGILTRPSLFFPSRSPPSLFLQIKSLISVYTAWHRHTHTHTHGHTAEKQTIPGCTCTPPHTNTHTYASFLLSRAVCVDTLDMFALFNWKQMERLCFLTGIVSSNMKKLWKNSRDIPFVKNSILTVSDLIWITFLLDMDSMKNPSKQSGVLEARKCLKTGKPFLVPSLGWYFSSYTI